MFNDNLKGTYETFGQDHLIALLVIFTICTVIYIYRKKLREKKLYDFTRYFLAISIITQEVLLNVYRLMRNEWMISTSLPFHLCGFAIIVTAIVLVTENKSLFMKTFFVMLIGATMALITPSIDYNVGFPHFRFIQFFVSHGLIVINFTYSLFVMEYAKEFRYKYVFHNVITLLSLALFNLVVNLMVDGNYLYLMAKPGEGTALDLFGEHPWYIINILLFGAPILLHIFYVPFLIVNKRRVNY